MELDFSKYKRIFVFGCSFAQWRYPTWANIVHQCAPDVPMYNFAQPGAGNSFISNRMTQVNRTYNFCETDLVMVMWTTLCREDRFVNNNWITVGNVFSQKEYDKSFVRKFCDPLGYLIKDLSTIDLATSYMKNLPCDYIDLLAVPFNLQITNQDDPIYKSVMHTYRDLISRFVHTPMHLVLEGFDENLSYTLNDGTVLLDSHPTPRKYCMYLLKINFPLTQAAIDYAEQSYEKVLDTKHEFEFQTVFPEIQHSHKNYYAYQHCWNIE